MANELPPLNKFRLITNVLVSGSTDIYQEDINVSTIILSGQISNVTDETHSITVKILKNGTSTPVTLLKNAFIPPNESLSPFVGKIVLEQNDKLIYETESNEALESVISVLENANE